MYIKRKTKDIAEVVPWQKSAKVVVFQFRSTKHLR